MELKYIFYMPLAILGLWVLKKLINGIKAEGKSASLAQNARQTLSSYVNVSLLHDSGQIMPNLAFPILAQSQQLQSLDVCVGQKMVSKRTKSIWRFRESQSLVQSFSLLIGTDSQCEILLSANNIDNASLFADAIAQAGNFDNAEISVKCRMQIIVQSQMAGFSHTEMAEMAKLSYVDGVLKMDFLPVSLSLSVNLSLDKIQKICSLVGNSSLIRNAQM